MAQQVTISKLAQLEKAWPHRNVKAFSRTVRAGESHATNDEAYRALFGWLPGNGKVMDHFAQHPNVRTYEKFDGQFIKNGKIDFTTAAGAYQITKTTWDWLVGKYGFSDFEPHTQDLAYVALLVRRGALVSLLNNDFDSALTKCRNEWASLPTALTAQPKLSYVKALSVYEQHGGLRGAA